MPVAHRTLCSLLHHRLRQAPLRLLTGLLAGLFVLAALGGCMPGRTTEAAGPSVLGLLPAEWQPLAAEAGRFAGEQYWRPVNIDGDAAQEYLLFFTFDSGQVGALIYDAQIGGAGAVSATPIPVPLQPAGINQPYRIAPSYWNGAGSVGFVAPPGTPATAITVNSVRRPVEAGEAPDDQAVTADGVALPDELIIFGGKTVITVLWWRNEFNGYGVAQMSAAAGLEPLQWVNDELAVTPLAQVIGHEPLGGTLARSHLCRRAIFVRLANPEPADVVGTVYRPTIVYQPTDRGIDFCTGAPPSPYYPEGVVLAFLKPERAGAEALADPAAWRRRFMNPALSVEEMAPLLALADFDGPDNVTSPEVVVEVLAAPGTIPVDANYRTSAGYEASTVVCALVRAVDFSNRRTLQFELLLVPGGQRTVEGANGPEVQFTADRLVITSIQDVSSDPEACPAVIDPGP